MEFPRWFLNRSLQYAPLDRSCFLEGRWDGITLVKTVQISGDSSPVAISMYAYSRESGWFPVGLDAKECPDRSERHTGLFAMRPPSCIECGGSRTKKISEPDDTWTRWFCMLCGLEFIADEGT